MTTAQPIRAIANGVARVEISTSWRDPSAKKVMEQPAYITAKRVRTVVRVFERATFKNIRRRHDWQLHPSALLAYRIGDGPWIERSEQGP